MRPPSTMVVAYVGRGGVVAGGLVNDMGVAGQGVGVVLDASVFGLWGSVAFVGPANCAGVG
jgi:hypothetical protein